MPAPTVVLLAAGDGTRMRSALPKVLHPICGRPMILWPLLAAREAGAERVIVVDNPKRLLAEHLPDGVEVAIQQRPRGTGDAVAAAAGLIDPGRPRGRVERRHAADHGRGDRRGRRRPRGVRRRGDAGLDGARGPERLWPRAPRRRRQRRARRRDEVRRRRDRGRALDPRGQRRPVRVRRRRAARSAARPRARTTPRASSTCPTSCRPCSPPASPSRPARCPIPTSRSASTTASTSRT